MELVGEYKASRRINRNFKKEKSNVVNHWRHLNGGESKFVDTYLITYFYISFNGDPRWFIYFR